MRHRLQFAAFALFAHAVQAHAAADGAMTLPLDRYLQEVRLGHAAVLASIEAKEGAALRAREGSLPLTPMFLGSAQLMSDAKPTISPSVMGSKTVYNTYTVGLSQQTRFGFAGKITYNLMYTDIVGVNPVFVPTSKFHDAKPMIELTQSLWKNAFGREARAQEGLIEASALALNHAESYKARVKRSEAEIAYWRVFFARQAVTVQKEALGRGVKLRDWNERRVRSQLGDKADLLQSEAALEVRKLELQGAQDELAAASRAFNSLRGLDAETVEEELDAPEAEQVEALSAVLKGEKPREDTEAAAEQLRAADLSASLGAERARPTFDLFGGYAYNGRDTASSGALTDALKADKPTWVAGLRFSTSLDFGMASDVRAGYARERNAADLNLQRRFFDDQREWKDLSARFGDAKRRFKLTRGIEQIQKEKLAHEKERLSRGRTTTYQLLLFEQDFAQAQLSRIRAQAEVLQLAAQMKLYAEGGRP